MELNSLTIRSPFTQMIILCSACYPPGNIIKAHSHSLSRYFLPSIQHLGEHPPSYAIWLSCCNTRFTVHSLKKRSPKGFLDCTQRTLFVSTKNPFGFHVKPSVERVLHGTQKVSTWNWNGFYLEPIVFYLEPGFFKGFSYEDSRKTLLGSR